MLFLLVMAYLAAAAYQLGLPGLHYDEAKEAGLNALELLHGAPLTAFRAATITFGPWSLPLMVQDYIGALNVYLVMPFLALSGVGVPNVRWPAILVGLLTLLLLERAVSEWWTWQTGSQVSAAQIPPGETAVAPAARLSANAPVTPLTWVGLVSVALLALSPSFVFWSRQGIFVTNLTQPLCLFAIWQGMRWLRRGEAGAFVWTGFSAGLAFYAKLTTGWLLGPFAVLAGLAYLRQWTVRHRASPVAAPSVDEAGANTGANGPVLSLGLLLAGVAAFLVALSPLILFNVQTSGTWAQLSDNLAESYYGVDNRAWVDNLAIRAQQLGQTLRGDHFWYLGGIYGNPAAPWLALMGATAVLLRPRWMGPPLLLLASAVGLSVFTISDLFITHYALLQPVMAGVAALGLATWFVVAMRATTHLPRSIASPRRQIVLPVAVPPVAVPPVAVPPVAMKVVAVLVVVLWLGLDGYTTARYHGALAHSGGLADHSDATYHFAYHLRYNGMGAPIALDWGMDAPVRFLTENAVRPVEIFGYASPAAPDADFAGRLAQFLDNLDNVYVLRSPEQTVFAGRRAAFLAQVEAQGRTAVQLETFFQRDGAPLFELWRVE